jgi:hypothetical protein
MVKRVLTVAVIAVLWPIVWVLSRWDDESLYDDMEDEDPDDEYAPTPVEPDDDE